MRWTFPTSNTCLIKIGKVEVDIFFMWNNMFDLDTSFIVFQANLILPFLKFLFRLKILSYFNSDIIYCVFFVETINFRTTFS